MFVFSPAGLHWVFMPVISFLLYLHVCCCLLLAFSLSCLSLSAYSSFDSILHCHCILLVYCLLLHSCLTLISYIWLILPLCRLFFACHLCMLSPKYTPWPLHFFYLLHAVLCSLPNSVTIHMAPLCEHLMAQDNSCTSA